MIAGLLREPIEIYKSELTKNAVGEQETNWILKTKTRSQKINKSGSRNVENDEVVYNYTKIFKVRIYVDVDEFDRIKWNKKFYRILNIDIDKEQQTKIIETELINE